jgi:hypothetical protein
VETLRARARVAYWIGKSGESRQAAYLYERLRQDQRRVLGLQHPDTMSTDRDIEYWSQQ